MEEDVPPMSEDAPPMVEDAAPPEEEDAVPSLEEVPMSEDAVPPDEDDEEDDDVPAGMHALAVTDAMPPVSVSTRAVSGVLLVSSASSMHGGISTDPEEEPDVPEDVPDAPDEEDAAPDAPEDDEDAPPEDDVPPLEEPPLLPPEDELPPPELDELLEEELLLAELLDDDPLPEHAAAPSDATMPHAIHACDLRIFTGASTCA